MGEPEAGTCRGLGPAGESGNDMYSHLPEPSGRRFFARSRQSFAFASADGAPCHRVGTIERLTEKKTGTRTYGQRD